MNTVMTRNSKKVQLVVVMLLVIGIVLAGTFAWYSFTQSALNIFEGWTNPDVNLHDDYEKGQIDKDVYVENSGRMPLYIRVRFDEYLEINGDPRIGGVKGDVTTWPYHAYAGTRVDDCGEETHEYYAWTMGQGADASGNSPDPNKGYKLYVPAPYANRALYSAVVKDKGTATEATIDSNQVREPKEVVYGEDLLYATDANGSTKVTLKMLYDQIDTKLKTGTVKADLEALYAELDDPTLTDKTLRTEKQAEIDAFLKTNGLGYYDVAVIVADNVAKTSGSKDGVTIDEFVANDHLSNDPDGYKFVPLKRTLTTEKVYTMAEWISAGTPTGDFWIMDNDGWCYWGNILMPGQATGLLLSEVELDEDNPPAGVWWYGINVKLQAATYNDIGRFATTPGDDLNAGGGISDQGNMVLMAVSGNYVFDKNPAEVGAPGNLGSNAPVYTYVNNKDNTFRQMVVTGNKVTYGELFVYTGDIPAKATGDIFKHTVEYNIGKKLYKEIVYLDDSKVEKNVEFVIVDANETAYNGTTFVSTYRNSKAANTAVVEGYDGKHYIHLRYKPAGATDYIYTWLAPGADRMFNKLNPVNTDKPSAVPLSDGDDVLVWTSDDKPGGGAGSDRSQEVDNSGKLKIGDKFSMDGVTWLVIGKDTKDLSPTKDKMLIITESVVQTSVDPETGGIAAALTAEFAKTKATNGGVGYDKISAISGVTAKTLTVQEAMDYFSNNAARAANDLTAKADAWWLSEDGCYVDTNGGFKADGATTSGTPAYNAATKTVGLRVATWVDIELINNAPKD